MERTSPGPQAVPLRLTAATMAGFSRVLDGIPLISAAGGLEGGGQLHMVLKGHRNARAGGSGKGGEVPAWR